MSGADRVVVSLGDALLRASDVELLRGPHWLNDRIIGFCFEFFHQHIFDTSDRVCFLSPEVSHFLKLVARSELPAFLEPLNLPSKDVILVAVNDASDPSAPGGTHWSLMLSSKQVGGNALMKSPFLFLFGHSV